MFDIKIQSPFTSQPLIYTDCNLDKATVLFKDINWAELYQQIEATGSSPDSPFYYYEVARKNSFGAEEILCISGYLDDRINVGYLRPKMERKGFFIKKDVLNPKFLTQMDGLDLSEGTTFLKAFLIGDSNYLEENMYNKESRFNN